MLAFPTLCSEQWRRDMRWEAQEIIPGVLLGPSQVSKSSEALKVAGVTHIICVRDERHGFVVRPRFPDLFSYLVLDIEDGDAWSLIKNFARMKGFVDEALAVHWGNEEPAGKVFVHCHMVMYLMDRFAVSWDEALSFVVKQRVCVALDDPVYTQIQEFDTVCMARRALLLDRPSNPRKRSRDVDGDYGDVLSSWV
ncbi:hypothetical protein V5O48_005223 [Marasmius crinis-equi]|uniref:Tyrosine-protein phosphatase domain-containing protein n=1 Tax=Marasmius crinis-equi TaxID=585013 RepID=A0ABR3FNL9_9AGAR